jgi:SAM-dependent methyltransferase
MSILSRLKFRGLLHYAMKNPLFAGERTALIAPTQGRVLEICFETDKNLPYYSPWVTEISIVCVAGASADRKVTTTDRGLRVERIFSGLETNALPFEDAHFDWVVTTLALCRIPNPPIILREIRRVLKPSGSYIFIEHGISADRKVNRWQRRMKRVWRRWGGCELDREIDRMIRDAGLEIGSIDRYQLGRPRFLSSIYRGSARRAKDHSLAAAVD